MPMIIISGESHLDHGLSAAHLEFIKEKFADKHEFFVETIELPTELDAIECGLYGPLMGDGPINDGQCVFSIRGERKAPSRCIDKPTRNTRLLTVVAGPHKEFKCMLYTTYGGPEAPREPSDPSLKGQELTDAVLFWNDHALAL